ncbi:MAG: phosphoribosylglycinamide formyltransferase [Spirochaetaceae bacterium]|nr:MAG: phosphoribosylglycinamide formyltransferase [Spirochaetaceae bacterium]
MADLAVFASGSGSNFEAIAAHLCGTAHRVACLVCDKSNAAVLQRCRRLGIASFVVCYSGRDRVQAEQEILSIVQQRGVELIALAGFMRLLSAGFIDSFDGPILNVHPSLLPRHPGCGAIETSYRSGDNELGITIHHVDSGLDTGPVILQKSFRRTGGESLQQIEQRIHELEHQWFPTVIRRFLDNVAQGNHDGGSQ